MNETAAGRDTTTRRRRSADEARAAILQAAEELLENGGPAALRLQEVARRAGISHPTLLHHFGSREGLIDALNLKTAAEIADFLESFRVDLPESQPDRIGHVFDKFRDGFAQRLVWLTMSTADDSSSPRPNVERIIDAMTHLRSQMARRRGLPNPSRADVEFIFHLVLVAAVGDAIVGDAFRLAKGDADRIKRRAAFIDRFKQMLRTL